LFPVVTWAQNNTVTGKVVDAANGEAIIGASIIVVGTNTGISSDASGSFKINVPLNATLRIQSVGYITVSLKADFSNQMLVKLSSDHKGLDEVVVIGYGVQRKSDLTGSISSIKGSELTKIGGSNVAEALQGKATGVQVLNVGTPGAAPLVRIRGIGTNGDPNPLYVVDGMFVNDIQYLNSQDVASMEILKDASATAIYGSRGANGVILVTTKKGKNGKPVINFNGSEGFDFLTRRYEVADAAQYAQLQNQINGKDVYPNAASLGKGTNWIDEITQKGKVREYQLSVTGGSDKGNYNISGGYFKQNGVVKFTDYDRLTLRVNNEYKIAKGLSIGENISMSSSNTTGIASSSGLRTFNAVYRISPLLSVYGANGNFTAGQDPDIINPYAALFYGKDANNNNLRIVGNAWLNYELIKGLTYRSSYGIDYSADKFHFFEPAYAILSPNQIHAVNSLTDNRTTNYVWLWENTLTYDKQIGKDHHLNLLGGVTAQKRTYDFLGGVGQNLGFDSPDYQYLGVVPATNLSISTSAFKESIFSYLARATYSFKDRYLFTGTFRADGSSKFGPNNRYGYFPSVALGWRVSEESFLKKAEWVNNLKLRASWGQIGNDKINNYIAYSTVTQDPVYNPVFNGVAATNGTILTASNKNIKWERTEQTDLGLEFGTLNNRLNFEFDYFNRDTKDLLLVVPIPGGSTGINATYSNVGSIRNRGIEFMVSWNDRIRDFSYGIKVTGSTYKNKVLDFGGQIITSSTFMSNSIHRGEAGQPIGYFYGYKVKGIFQNQAEIDRYNATAAAKAPGKVYQSNVQPGDFIYEDVDGDGYITGNDQTNIGSPHPKFIGGLTLTASYKGFDFGLDLMGSFGAKIYNSARNQIGSTNTNISVEYLNAWTPTNTNTTIPRFAVSSNNSLGSSFNVQDGSYLKIRNVELGYNLKNSFLRNVKIVNLRLFVNLTNPLYITKYKGFSPELANYNVLEMGTDYGIYPVSGTAKIGLNATF
jgi:TonB-linked SusC/RagA family outer membrane protein